MVARQDIAAGEVLTTSVLALRQVPADAALAESFTTIDELVGRATRYPLVRNEQFSPFKLVDADGDEGSGLAYSVPRGMRALSVPVSEVSGAGGLIVPGDWVDVLVATEYRRLFGPSELLGEKDDERHPTVLTVLQDVLVLAVGQEFTPRADQGRDQATLRVDETEPQPGAASVTLAVTLEEAQTLFLAAQEGTLGLALRAFGDDDTQTLNPKLSLAPADGLVDELAASR